MTVHEIAKRLRLSPATVSRALNPQATHPVSKEVKERIRRYAERTGYVPNTSARQLVQGRSQTLGIILYSAFGEIFFSDFLSKVEWGIHSALDASPAYGSRFFILPRGRPLRQMDTQVLGGGLDGLLVSVIGDYSADRLEDLVYAVEGRWQRPTVAINLGPMKRGKVSTVSFSNQEGAYKAVMHLIQRQHRHLGLLYTDDGAPDVKERLDGVEAALRDHQMTVSRDLRILGRFTQESGYEVTLELFRRPGANKVTALFCTNDEMAIGAMRAIRALGKRCPQDVAVMGFDGLEVGRYTDPRLSSVSQPFRETAEVGVRLLVDLIEGRKQGPIHLTVPTQLIVRDST